MYPSVRWWPCVFTGLLLLVAGLGPATAAKKDTNSAVIEEVTTKQLERLLNDKDFVAVYWCKWFQKECYSWFGYFVVNI